MCCKVYLTHTLIRNNYKSINLMNKGALQMFKRPNKFTLLFTIMLIFFLVITLYGNSQKPYIKSKSAILMDATSGKVLFNKNAQTAYPVASMSKLMTEYIVLDHIASGAIHWEDMVTMSESANQMIASAIKIPVKVGDILSVRDLFAAMVISSANNATIALAEHVAGTEEAFTTLMNEKAAEIGLSKQAFFVNSTGLPAESSENEMSAEDVATLSYHLLKDYEEVLDIASQTEYQLDSNGIYLYSTNKMLDQKNGELYFDGLDGLKTGFTDAAGYGFAGTAHSGNQRLISVVIHAKDEDHRFLETKKLFSFGFGESHSPSIKSVFSNILN